MALEPITRQEKIIAGQDLTPITRMERFLKEFGGSGGGGGKVIYAWDSADDTVVDESGNAVTAEQATKDMFNVVIEDVVDGGYMIPWRVRSGEGYVRFYVIWGEEYTNITIGTSPK